MRVAAVNQRSLAMFIERMHLLLQLLDCARVNAIGDVTW